MLIHHLKLSNHKQEIIDEVNDGKFSMNLSDHIIHLKSFIDKDLCKQVVDDLNKIKGADKSSQYTDGLMNDEADSYFDPTLESLETVKKKIFDREGKRDTSFIDYVFFCCNVTIFYYTIGFFSIQHQS